MKVLTDSRDASVSVKLATGPTFSILWQLPKVAILHGTVRFMDRRRVGRSAHRVGSHRHRCEIGWAADDDGDGCRYWVDFHGAECWCLLGCTAGGSMGGL